MEREEREQEGTENKNGGEEPRLLRLTRRDKELLAHVSVARYLTGEQIRRLIFQDKKSRDSAERERPGEGIVGGSVPTAAERALQRTKRCRLAAAPVVRERRQQARRDLRRDGARTRQSCDTCSLRMDCVARG